MISRDVGFINSYGNMLESMKRDFRFKHSEIMEYFQCIEYDLKWIYAKMSADDFDENMDMLETANMGNTLRMLKQLDNSDGRPYLSKSDYELLDQVRELRNYWCHQCYLDWVFIDNDYDKMSKLRKVTNRLENELKRVCNLYNRLEKFYYDNFE